MPAYCVPCRRTTMISKTALDFLKAGESLHTTIFRNYAKAELPFEYEIPQKLKQSDRRLSGDPPLESIDLSQPLLKYQNCEKYKNASPTAKKLLSLEYSHASNIRQLYQENLRRKVRQHALDDFSREVRIADLTTKIRFQQAALQDYKSPPKRKPVVEQICIKESIEKRRGHLVNIQKQDYKKFEWLLEELNLTYKPFPEPEKRVKSTRKKDLMLLTEEYCANVKQNKLNKYREELESQQVGFLKDKAAKYRIMASEEKRFGLNEVAEESLREAELAEEKAKRLEAQLKKAVDSSEGVDPAPMSL